LRATPVTTIGKERVVGIQLARVEFLLRDAVEERHRRHRVAMALDLRIGRDPAQQLREAGGREVPTVDLGMVGSTRAIAAAVTSNVPPGAKLAQRLSTAANGSDTYISVCGTIAQSN